MEKKIYFISIILVSFIVFFIVFSNPVYACISIPSLELKNSGMPNREKIFFVEYKNETAVLYQLNEVNSQCNCLRDEDIEIIKSFIMNGYSVKEQTNDEYNLFLEEVRNANKGRPESCLAYLAVHRNDSWTGYVKTGYMYENGKCIAATCSGAVANLLWNDLNNTEEQKGTEGKEKIEKQQNSYCIIIAVIIAIIIILLMPIILNYRKMGRNNK